MVFEAVFEEALENSFFISFFQVDDSIAQQGALR